jgi:hypothetical protein
VTEGEIEMSFARPLREFPGATGKITSLPGELTSSMSANHFKRKVCLTRQVYGFGKVARSEFDLMTQRDKVVMQSSKEWDMGGIREVDPDEH